MDRIFDVAREEATRPGTFFYHIADGYHYHRSHDRPGTMYFKCVRFERGCRGRAILDDHVGFEHTANHNHERDVHYSEEMFVKRNILARCRALDYAPFSRIIDEEIRGAHPEIRARIFAARLRTSMRNARLQNYPRVPNDLRDLTRILMNPQYTVITMTEDGLSNIYAGSVTDALGAHHVLFLSERMLAVARDLRILHGDGTFKSKPAGSNLEQVYCIVGSWNNHNVPLALVLMESRTQQAYEAVLELLQHRLGPDVHCTRVITDFELAAQNAWESVFHVRVQGCLWHACRRLVITAQELGLTIQMRDIPEVKRIVRLSMALPLLPKCYMRRGLLVLIQEARDEGNYIYQTVQPFLQYIWTSWIRSERTCARLTVFGSSARTNNTNESFNKTLRLETGLNPSVYGFIAASVKIEQRTQDIVMALNAGRRVGRGQRVTTIMNNDNIQQLSIGYFNRALPRSKKNKTGFRYSISN